MKHWPIFAEFCQKELATGGPDPQIQTLRMLSRTESLESRVWLIGCYGAHHCVPSAYAIWQRFTPRMILKSHTSLASWLRRNWSGLPVRNEMRSHRMIEKRLECLIDFAAFARQYDPSHYTNYDDAWVDMQKRVKYFGRYMAIKALEMLWRFGDFPYALHDMRARGGWSPRRCLSVLWRKSAPECVSDRRDNTTKTLEIVEALFARTRRRLRTTYTVRVTPFQLQVLLCEYKEALAGGYYPGASLDEELVFIETVRANTHISVTPIYRARARGFDRRYLGEWNDWTGPRPELFIPFKVNHALR